MFDCRRPIIIIVLRTKITRGTTMQRRRRSVLFSTHITSPQLLVHSMHHRYMRIHVKRRDWGLQQSWSVGYEFMTNAFRRGVHDLGHIYVCVVWVRFFYCFTIKTDISGVNIGLCFETHTNNAIVENIIWINYFLSFIYMWLQTYGCN